MIRLLAVRIQFFKLALALIVIGIFPVAVAADSTLSAEDLAIIDQGKELAEQARKLGAGAYLQNPDMKKANVEARALFQELRSKDKTLSEMQRLEAQKGIYKDHKILVFASQSLGEQGMNDLLSSVSGMSDAVVVFRGIPDGMNIGEGVMAIQRLAAKFNPVPNVIINPTLFKTYKVTSVPAIIMVDDIVAPGEHPKAIAQVAGISDPSWLIRETKSGQKGDLGIRGPTEDIGEPDLIEVAKKKVAAIDWNAKKHQSIERFWDKQNFNVLPRANKSRVRSIDPSIQITDDIVAPDGTFIAKKGAIINPLDTRPFTQTVIVFDPLDKKQMEILDKAIPSIKAAAGFQRLTLIATGFDKEKGWDSYKDVSNHFDSPVYLLTPDLISRFELEHTPSVITANNKVFVVKELAMEDVQ